MKTKNYLSIDSIFSNLLILFSRFVPCLLPSGVVELSSPKCSLEQYLYYLGSPKKNWSLISLSWRHDHSSSGATAQISGDLHSLLTMRRQPSCLFYLSAQSVVLRCHCACCLFSQFPPLILAIVCLLLYSLIPSSLNVHHLHQTTLPIKQHELTDENVLIC